jgi:hypothetical protein
MMPDGTGIYAIEYIFAHKEVPMPRVAIDCDELYPFFEVLPADDDPRLVKCDVSEETLARWESVMKAFGDVQKEMRRLWDGVPQEPLSKGST